MKKILGISLVAVLAATPLMANAAGELASGVQIQGGVTVSNAENGGNALATKSYVQGAYNTVETDIANVNNAVTLLNNNAETAGSVLNAVKTQAANGDYDAEEDYASGTIGHAIKNTSAAAVNALDSSAAQSAENRADGLALSITQTDGVITSISGSIAPNTYDAYGAASGAVAALDATESQTAGTDGLALSITQTDGVITSISGSIAANTYDAYGAASQAEGRINATIGDTTMTTTNQTLTGAIEEVNQAVSTLTTNANNTYQQITDSTVATGTYAHITQGNGVGANLVSLNGAVVANDGAIATINNKQIPVVTDWSSGTVSNTKISDLVTAQN